MGEGSHPSRVKVYGPGVEKTGLKANEPTYFTVDCSEAGQGGYSPRGGTHGNLSVGMAPTSCSWSIIPCPASLVLLHDPQSWSITPGPDPASLLLYPQSWSVIPSPGPSSQVFVQDLYSWSSILSPGPAPCPLSSPAPPVPPHLLDAHLEGAGRCGADGGATPQVM